MYSGCVNWHQPKCKRVLPTATEKERVGHRRADSCADSCADDSSSEPVVIHVCYSLNRRPHKSLLPSGGLTNYGVCDPQQVHLSGVIPRFSLITQKSAETNLFVFSETAPFINFSLEKILREHCRVIWNTSPGLTESVVDTEMKRRCCNQSEGAILCHVSLILLLEHLQVVNDLQVAQTMTPHCAHSLQISTGWL